MKYTLLIMCLLLYYPKALSQKNVIWKERICRQMQFHDQDSILFCHLFDSLNKEYRVTRIIRIKNKKDRFIPFLGNTICLTDTAIVYISWLEELSHAVQFSGKNRGNNKTKFCCQVIGVLWRYVFKNKTRKSLDDVYEELYWDKKGFEYEAHDIIQPKLYSYLKQRMYK